MLPREGIAPPKEHPTGGKEKVMEAQKVIPWEKPPSRRRKAVPPTVEDLAIMGTLTPGEWFSLRSAAEVGQQKILSLHARLKRLTDAGLLDYEMTPTGGRWRKREKGGAGNGHVDG